MFGTCGQDDEIQQQPACDGVHVDDAVVPEELAKVSANFGNFRRVWGACVDEKNAGLLCLHGDILA